MKMKGKLRQIFSKSKEQISFKTIADGDGLNFVLPQDQFDACKNFEGDDSIMYQFIYLQMLDEEGIAQPILNGYCIPPEEAVRLSEARDLFNLPPAWPGGFSVVASNTTTEVAFQVKLHLVDLKGNFTIHYKLNGPYLLIGETEIYLPTPEQWMVVSSIQKHQDLSDSEKNEYQNLLLINQLQKSKAAGVDIDLQHFNNLITVDPNHVSVSIKEDESGNWQLTPIFGQEAPIEDIDRRLGQLNTQHKTQSLRIGNEIILLNEQKFAAAHEIIINHTIPKSQIQDFVKSPSAFLNASLVDLDTGFSLRVRGAARFKHGYFGDTDVSDLDWFVERAEKDPIIPPQKLDEIIKDLTSLELFKKKFEDASKHGVQEIDFDEKVVDISNPQAVQNALNLIKKKLLDPPEEIDPGPSDTGKEKKKDIIVLDIEKHDDELSKVSETVKRAVQDILFRGELQMDAYARKPFPHQEEGIRWILGLMLHSFPKIKDKAIHGGLLADDMGLGKTYMALVSIFEFYTILNQENKTQKPVLVVAPLSLLENWKDEVALTFNDSPFNDIIILQSDGDLNRFKEKGAKREISRQNEEIERDDNFEDAIQYSLNVGKTYGLSRLDLPKRLVLTTYQTLRDYQFSLCRIDWSVVVFDEAQNIKNPNALQTIAAKALKAQFKLITTGTPVENHLGDFWCLFDTLQPGHLGLYQEFRNRYMSPITKASSDEVSRIRESIGRKLREDAGVLMLRRVKEDQLEGLPTKTVYVGISETKNSEWIYEKHLSSNLDGEQLAIYNAVINSVSDKNSNPASKDNPVLRGLHQIRDVSLHPGLVDRGELNIPDNEHKARYYVDKSAKLQSVFTLLQTISKREEKVIIFAVNKRLQRFLKIACYRLMGEHTQIINGDTKAVSRNNSQETRRSIIQQFEAKTGFAILIMSPIAAGVGFTITGANNVIHLERHWNPAKEAQATDRVYRIGQKKNVNVYIPILHHPKYTSFDVNLHELLSRKTNLKDAVITPENINVGDIDVFPGGTHPEEQIQAHNVIDLPWEHFEALIAEIFSRIQNANVMMTANSNDRGCDVVVISNDKNHTLIQCKHTGRDVLHGEHPVRELLAAPGYYKEKLNKEFKHLCVATNAKKFSKPTREAAKRENVELIGYKELSKWLSDVKINYSDIFKRLQQTRI
jgi:SNF2 family DNA or RNA helicase